MTDRDPPAGVPTLAAVVAAVLGLGAVAVAQPILEVVGAEPGYLVAHDLGTIEVVLFPLVLVAAALVPLPAVVIARRFSAEAGIWAAAAVLGAWTGLIVLHVGVRLTWAGALTAVSAVAAGGAVVTVYGTSSTARRWSGALAVLPPVVVVWFWLTVPTSLFDPASGDAVVADDAAPYDVVVLIFDELPTSSLMGADGNLLPRFQEGFGRLASDGIWYRNAVTVETLTAEAIPAVLSGAAVEDGTLPVTSAHPNTLMSILSGTHDVSTVEAITDLCLPDVCTPTRPPLVERWRTLLIDTGVVFAHLVTPPSVATALPPIDAAWAGFAATYAGDGSFDVDEELRDARQTDRRLAVDAFIEEVPDGGDPPTVAVGHFLLPHRPWTLLPDGTTYVPDDPPGYVSRGWGSDEFFVAQGWQRHMLQVGYADAVVSAVVDRLQEQGRYDATMLVVLADHGVAFIPGVGDMRATHRRSARWILPVPLFVKYPAAAEGVPAPGTVVDTRVETIDVVPTVMDVLDAAVDPTLTASWDGRSLLGLDGRGETTEMMLRGEPFAYHGGVGELRRIAALRERWFTDPWALVPDPSLRPLLGAAIADLDTSDDPHTQVTIGDAGVMTTGTVTAESTPPGSPPYVAVANDGHIVAVTKAFDDGGKWRFATLVGPGEARTGGDWSAWTVVTGDPPTLTR